MTTPLTDLETTVERIRAERFPNLPPNLVATILKTEKEYVENRADAMRRLSAAIQEYLDSKGA